MKAEMLKSRLALVLLLVLALGSLSAGGQEQAQQSVPTLVLGAAATQAPVAPQPAAEMNAAVDTFLSTVPDSFYAVGTIDAVKDMLANDGAGLHDLRGAAVKGMRAKGGAVLYDLRGAESYAAGHIPGAVNLPIRTLAQNLDKIPTDRPVLLSCGGGYLAAMGVAVLRSLGYTNVQAFPGSYDAWTAANEPVSTDAVAPRVYGPPAAAPALIAQADTFLRSLPDDFLAIDAVPALKEAMANGALLVDVRPAAMYEAGHIPGAINIPIQQLPANLDKIPRDKPVVVSCGSGYLAGMALAALQLRGYTNVRSFPPSYAGWAAAGAAEMNTAVDTFLSTVPDSFYAVGTIDAVKDMLANDGAGLHDLRGAAVKGMRAKGGAVLYDLRGAESYAAGHIPGAVNLPIRTLAQNLDKIPTDRPVLLSCGGGYLAAMGVAVLRSLGYTNVQAFPGSYDAWTAANEPVSTDAVAPRVYGPPAAAPALIAQADTFLRSLPDDFLAIDAVPALKEAMANGALLVDVRPAAMYEAGHIPGAINIPIQQLPANLDKIPRDKPVVVSCGSGYLAGMALAALQLRGYTNVRSFPPSYAGWTTANQPVEK